MDEEEDLNCNEEIDNYPIWDMDNDVETYVDADADADVDEEPLEVLEPLETILEVNGTTAIIEDIEVEMEGDFEEANEGTALLPSQQQHQQQHQPHLQETANMDSISRSDADQQIAIEQTRNNRHYNRVKEPEQHSGSSDSG